MNKLIKFFWIISILLYLVSLLLIYAFLLDRDQIGYHANKWGMPDMFVSRQTFFYICLLSFLGVNVLLYVLYKLLQLSKRTVKTEQAFALRRDLAYWMLGFAGTINIIIILAVAFFGLLNRSEQFQDSDFAIIVYVAPLLLFLIFGLLIYILMKRRA